jgi:phospholipase C
MLRLEFSLQCVSVVGLALILGGCGGGSGSNSSGPPSFTLSVSPGAITVVQGVPQGASSTVTITPVNGFSGSVSLSITSSLPTGVTANFSPSSATTSSTLTLTASPTATTGTVTLTIAGVSGMLTRNANISLNTIALGQINHVVIIFQENRTPDNLFQGLCTATGSPGCDPTGTNPSKYDLAQSGLANVNGSIQTVPLTSNSLVTTYDLGHDHYAFLDICDYQSGTNSCAMDGAWQIGCGVTGCPPTPCPQNPAVPACPEYQYIESSQVQPYLTMAMTYTFGDHMFQTNEGPSFPAHQYILSGTSEISDTSTIAISANPYNNTRPDDDTAYAGCLAPPGSEVLSIDTSQLSPLTAQSTLTNQLCFEHPTLTDLLDKASLSWKYYAPTAGSIWTAPDAIEHMCQPSPAYPSKTSECEGSDWTGSDPKVFIENSGDQIVTDIANQQLAAVSWVIPTGANSDHAGNATDNGPSWVSSIVNAVGGSQYWADTAIIVAWDDWGGWYDHVPPSSIRNSYEYGLRVPLIVISPYAKQAYISHVNHDFGSVLKFVETVFDLGFIDPTVGYADQRSDDLSDCFNFSQFNTFMQIEAPLKADYFLNDKSPPTPPDDD